MSSWSYYRSLAALQARPEIWEAYVFGSQARGSASAHSDLDIAAFVEPAALEEPGFGYEAVLGADLQ